MHRSSTRASLPDAENTTLLPKKLGDGFARELGWPRVALAGASVKGQSVSPVQAGAPLTLLG